MKIGVFCSANNHIDKEFFTMTDALGRWIGREGHTLVYGGCNLGLMECVARAVHEEGGRVIGVIPRLLEQGGRLSEYIDIQMPCDNLSDRKELMLAQSDVFIALPGGIGTLDEVFTVAASATLAYHNKRVILYNIKGFWAPLIALLDDLQARGMTRGDYHKQVTVAGSLEEIVALLSE